MEIDITPEAFCSWLEKYVEVTHTEFQQTRVTLSPRLEPIAQQERLVILTGISRETTEAGRLILSVEANVYPRVVTFTILPLGNRIEITARCLYPMFGDYLGELLETAVSELGVWDGG